MAKRHVLSPAAIDGLVSGALADPMTPGLRIEAQSSGKKIWKYERRVSGSGIKVRLTLGNFPAWTMAAARESATGLNEKN